MAKRTAARDNKVKTRVANPRPSASAFKVAAKKDGAPNSRSKLLDAALELFSRHSFHGTTTKMIAQQAGVNEALIMRHFKNKEGLFLAVLETRVSCDSQALPYPAQSSLENELILFAKSRLADCSENSDFMRIVLAQALIDSDFRKYVQREFQKPGSEQLQARLFDLQRSGAVARRVNLNHLEETVSDQIFAIMYISVLVYEHDARTTAKHITRAMTLIARGCR